MNPADKKKFDEIKARCDDVFASHGQDIKDNKFLRMAAEVFSEQRWLIQKLTELMAAKG